jgi:hypothetical protein
VAPCAADGCQRSGSAATTAARKRSRLATLSRFQIVLKRLAKTANSAFLGFPVSTQLTSKAQRRVGVIVRIRFRGMSMGVARA